MGPRKTLTDYPTIEETIEIAKAVCEDELWKRLGLVGVKFFGRLGSGGGSGPGPGPQLSIAVGGSGTLYGSLTAAIAGETSSSQTFAPQAGTQAGIVVLPGALSSTPDAYKDFYVVNVSVAPSNGLVFRYARVSASVGASLTIDEPWNFAAESTLALISVARVALLQDTVENVTVNKDLELDLEGHRVEGGLTVTAGNFFWLRGGSGWLTDGIQMTNAGCYKLEDVSISRRGATIYALLMTEAQNLGRSILNNCRFFGRVAGRRGRSGWEITNCINVGLADTVNDIPYALVESIPGVAIVLTQVDVNIDSQFSGAILYSENSLTGATAYASIQTTIRPSSDFFQPPVPQRRFAFARAVGAGVLTPTITTGAISITAAVETANTVSGFGVIDFTNFGSSIAMLAVQDFTGTATLTLSLPTFGTAYISGVCQSIISLITVEGTATMTGAVTLAGNAFVEVNAEEGAVRPVYILSSMTGSVTLSVLVVSVVGSIDLTILWISANQTAGAPTVSISSIFGFDRMTEVLAFSHVVGITPSISVGAWTISSSVNLRGTVFCEAVLNTTVSGGTWTISGPWTICSVADDGSGIVNRHLGTGGTLTVSSTFKLIGGRLNTVRLATSEGAGGTTVASGSVLFQNVTINTTTAIIARSTTATSTARAQGAVTFVGCYFESAITLVTATAIGGVAEAPASIVFLDCTFASTLTDRSGAGTITWAAATFLFKNCHVEGLVTFTGTSFTTVQAFDTAFNGNAANLSISMSGTRPTTYQLFRCTLAADYQTGKPDVVETWFTLPSAAALTRGQLVEINAVPQALGQTAPGVLAGVVLNATAGIGIEAIVVTKGRVLVNVTLATAAGDLVIVDAGGIPTQGRGVAPAAANVVPGQTVGIALEGGGTGQALCELNVR